MPSTPQQLTVAQLIAKLGEFPADAIVEVWDAYRDCPTDQVAVSADDGDTPAVLIAAFSFS